MLRWFFRNGSRPISVQSYDITRLSFSLPISHNSHYRGFLTSTKSCWTLILHSNDFRMFHLCKFDPLWLWPPLLNPINLLALTRERPVYAVIFVSTRFGLLVLLNIWLEWIWHATFDSLWRRMCLLVVDEVVFIGATPSAICYLSSGNLIYNSWGFLLAFAALSFFAYPCVPVAERCVCCPVVWYCDQDSALVNSRGVLLNAYGEECFVCLWHRLAGYRIILFIWTTPLFYYKGSLNKD